MHPRSATNFRYPAEMMPHGRSTAGQRMRRVDGILKPAGDRMMPPMTVPHRGGSWGTVLTDMPQHTNDMIGSNMVENLDSSNFDSFIVGLEKALIMFYNPEQQDNLNAAKEFGRAADRPSQYNHAYGAVNCSANNDLCVREGATNLPMFKLYSNGYDLSTIVHGKNFNSQQMQMLVKMTPVLTQPKVDYGVERLK